MLANKVSLKFMCDVTTSGAPLNEIGRRCYHGLSFFFRTIKNTLFRTAVNSKRIIRLSCSREQNHCNKEEKTIGVIDCISRIVWIIIIDITGLKYRVLFS